jgi:hypothetical protein
LQAQPNPGNGRTPGFRDGRSTTCTMRQRRALGEAALCATNAILDRRVNLLINRVVARPSGCHVRLLSNYPASSSILMANAWVASLAAQGCERLFVASAPAL